MKRLGPPEAKNAPTPGAIGARPAMTDPADIRRALLAAGFSPLPLRGKKPAFDGWQKKLETNDEEIRLWDSMWPDATNTGILTKFTPAIDIDIMVPDAAAA